VSFWEKALKGEGDNVEQLRGKIAAAKKKLEA
jgi:hypothetical protein